MPPRAFHTSPRALRPVLALLLAGISLAVSAQTFVLDPSGTGTWNVRLESGNGTRTIERPDLLSSFRSLSVSPSATLRQSPRAEFSLASYNARGVLVSATYTMRRETAGSSAPTFSLAAGQGSGTLTSPLDLPLSKLGTFPSAGADTGLAQDCTELVRGLLDGNRPYVLFELTPVLTTPDPIAAIDTWSRTGEGAPKLTLVFAPLPKATFTPLGSLAGPAFFSSPRAISADGATIVGRSQTAAGPTAFVWTAAKGMFDIGLGAQEANDVSGDGKTIVGQARSGYAFRWSATGKVANLGFGARANAVSADGAVVGGSAPLDGFPGPVAAVWTAAERRFLPTYWGLGTSRPASSEITGVSGDGGTFVGTSFPVRAGDRSILFRRPASGAASYIGFFRNVGAGFVNSGSGSVGGAISGDGRVLVGSAPFANFLPPGVFAGKWTAGDAVGLREIEGSYGSGGSSALGVSPDGSTVVGTYLYGGKPRAFLQRPGLGFQDLQSLLEIRGAGAPMAGWTLTEARDATILWDGRILVVGTGIDPLGRTQGFRAVIPTASSPATPPPVSP